MMPNQSGEVSTSGMGVNLPWWVWLLALLSAYYVGNRLLGYSLDDDGDWAKRDADGDWLKFKDEDVIKYLNKKNKKHDETEGGEQQAEDVSDSYEQARRAASGELGAKGYWR